MNNVQEQKQSRSVIIAIAFSQLDNLCESIQKKSVTLESLEFVSSKCLQLKKLCDAVNSGEDNKCLTYAELKPHLNGCSDLSAQFLDHRKKVANLLELCDEYHGMLSHKHVTLQSEVIIVVKSKEQEWSPIPADILVDI